MKHPNADRKWRFSVTLGDPDDDDSEVVYLDENGEASSEDDVEDFIGNEQEAITEAARRADIYEDGCADWVSQVTHHSRGLVDRSLYREPEGGDVN
jgi:hypothetical protein